MRIFSYVVARDYGFAPNPFYGFCTLATCKPKIRRHASIGDWIVGITAKVDRRVPGILYVMRVDQAVSFNEYWNDPAYKLKQPLRFGSLKQALGDNIYHRQSPDVPWIQADSHHSLENGQPNIHNIINDTQTDRVLISRHFAYWGSEAIDIPAQFLDFNGISLSVGRAHKSKFPNDFVTDFVQWFESLNLQGYLGTPYRWVGKNASWARSRP